jgi:GNAT superfamily N-acetyltransferase
MTDILLRLALEKDLSDLMELYSLLDGEGEGPQDLEVFRENFIHLQAAPKYFIFVAEAEDRVVGTFELLIMENLAHHGLPSAIVEDMVVRADFQGKGIGRAMMQHAMQFARQRGCYKLMLSSNRKRVDAHHFYESLGFQQHGISFQMDL